MRVFIALDRFSSISGAKVMAKKTQIFENSLGNFPEISLFFCFFGHNFGTRNASKSIKPSKDSYDSLVSNKNSSQKNSSWWWHPGPDDVIQM